MIAQSLPEALAALCGPDIVCVSDVPALVTEQLYPEERNYVARAVESRQAQFGTARLCARRALATLGVAAGAIVANEDRSPRWPPGIRGSIAHTARFCAAAVTNAVRVQGLGIDLESDAQVKPGMERMICTDAERAWIESCDPHTRAWLIPLVFSAKEAFYKCQYPITRAPLGFKDVELRIDLNAGIFCVHSIRPTIPERDRLLQIVGRFCRLPQLIVTSALLEA